jgi:endonuclease III
MGKGRSRLRGREKRSKSVRTVAVAVMRCHFLSHCDRLDHAEGNVAPLAEEFTIIVAVMLSGKTRDRKTSRE